MRPLASLLWGMVILVLLGLITMHHVPSHGDHSAGGPGAYSAAMTLDGSAPSDYPRPDGGSSALDELLAVCLAILAVGVTLLATWLAVRPWRLATNVTQRPWFAPTRTARAPPSTPVPRRLAALCVLRI